MGKILGFLILIIGVRIAYLISEIGRKPYAPKGSANTFFIIVCIFIVLAAFISSLFD